MILWLLAAAGAWALARSLGHHLLSWCRTHQIGVTNYRGRWVPWGLGLAWTLAAGGAVAAVAAIHLAASGLGLERFTPGGGAADPAHLALLAVWILWAGLIGWMDDLLGDRSRRGLRGHGSALLRGELTTGGAKLLLLGGGAVAVAAAVGSAQARPGLGWLTAAPLMALAVNGVNLLDLRPGRAFKGSLGLVGIAFLADGTASLPAIPGLAAALALMGWDLKEEGVLGDAGANALGALAGWSLVWALPWAGELAVLVFLGGLHLYAERGSLSDGIEGRPFLKWLDRLGRLEPGPRGEGGGAAN